MISRYIRKKYFGKNITKRQISNITFKNIKSEHEIKITLQNKNNSNTTDVKEKIQFNKELKISFNIIDNHQNISK